jgi:hypothetical protein
LLAFPADLVGDEVDGLADFVEVGKFLFCSFLDDFIELGIWGCEFRNVVHT